MKTIRHGLAIGIERVNNEFFLSLKAVGKLTHEDYEKINPMIDSALQGVKDPRVNVFIDGSEFEGWELRAAWDDLKLGLKHGNSFEKIAIFGNKKWQEYAAKIASWFVSDEARFFEDSDEAWTWLQKSDD
jgi:SpoIIAA-like